MLSCSEVRRLAVVTGANKGIGYYIALQLALSGLFDHVLLGCRNATLAERAVQSIQAELGQASSSSSSSSVQVSAAPLILGNHDSHVQFVQHLESKFGLNNNNNTTTTTPTKVDVVLVNNAAMAFKGSDPTPFERQTKPTLDVNYRGTVDFTECMLPLLLRGDDSRIVNVASMAGQLRQLSPALQAKFTAPDLDFPTLNSLVDDFEEAVQDGTFSVKGWGNSNYGFSKLAVVAATRIWARQYAGRLVVNCCCPGYCRTDMSSHRGTREPSDGARNAVIPATMPNPPTGAFFRDYQVGTW